MAAIFGENVKAALLKGIEAIGKGASSIAEGAQKKLDEINLEGRRREILNEIPKCVRGLYEQGVELPDQLMALLNELGELDEKLSAFRPQPAPAQEDLAEEVQPAEETCCEEIAPEAAETSSEETASDETDQQE